MKDCLNEKKIITGSLQEKNGTYYAVINLYVDGKRKPKWISTGLSIKGNNKRKAEKFLDEHLYTVNNGDSIPSKNVLVPAEQEKPSEPSLENTPTCNTGFPGDTILLVDYLRQWMERMKHMVKINTWEGYNAFMQKRILPYFEQYSFTLSSVEPYDIQCFYDYCLKAPRLDGEKGTISSSTLRRIHAVISKAMNDAVFSRLIKTTPVTAVITPKNNVYHAKYYTAAQTQLFLNAAKGDLCETPLVLMFYFGLRRSEALGLKIDAIDFENNCLTVQHTVTIAKGELLCQDITKTKKSHRTLPMMPEMAIYLKEVVRKVKGLQELFGPNFNPDGYLCIKNDGVVIFPTTINKHHNIILKKAGLPKIRPHDARHTNASILVKNGCNMKEIQCWLGHSDISTTGNLYSHLETDDLKKAAHKIAGKFSFSSSNVAEQPVA